MTRLIGTVTLVVLAVAFGAGIWMVKRNPIESRSVAQEVEKARPTEEPTGPSSTGTTPSEDDDEKATVPRADSEGHKSSTRREGRPRTRPRTMQSEPKKVPPAPETVTPEHAQINWASVQEASEADVSRLFGEGGPDRSDQTVAVESSTPEDTKPSSEEPIEAVYEALDNERDRLLNKLTQIERLY